MVKNDKEAEGNPIRELVRVKEGPKLMETKDCTKVMLPTKSKPEEVSVKKVKNLRKPNNIQRNSSLFISKLGDNTETKKLG